jgi:sigma-E factor negative regulatory protein RseA
MTEALRNSLSALVDQEATEFEVRKTLDAVKGQPELKSYWCGCQAISGTLNGDDLLGMTLVNRVNSELDEVSSASASTPKVNVKFLPAREVLPSRFGALIGQLAIAASVAFAVVVGVKVIAPIEMQSVVSSNESLEFIKFQLPGSKEKVSSQIVSGDFDGGSTRPMARILTEQDVKRMVSERLSSYLVRHAENTAVVGGTSVLPLARIMGHDEPIQ